MGRAVSRGRRKADESGMVPREEWAKTAVHKASSYSCGRCGKTFASPDEVYDHLDTEHSKPKRKGRP